MGFGREDPHVSELHFLGDFVVDSPLGIIEVGMHRHDGDVVFHGLHHTSLHHVVVGHLLESAEDKWMV